MSEATSHDDEEDQPKLDPQKPEQVLIDTAPETICSTTLG